MFIASTGGTADSDLYMLWYSETSGRKSLQLLELLVHHDDAPREYAYDAGTGKVLPLPGERDWLVVSMKNEWKEIY